LFVVIGNVIDLAAVVVVAQEGSRDPRWGPCTYGERELLGDHDRNGRIELAL